MVRHSGTKSSSLFFLTVIFFPVKRLITGRKVTLMKPDPEKEFLALLNLHKAIVYKVVHVYAPPGESRRDLFQEIVVSLWKAFPAFRGEAKISTWFYRVALNTAITNYRREKRSVPLHTLYSAPIEPFTGSPESDDEEVQLLYGAIGKLTTIDKAIMLLYLEERPYKEISQVLGISQASVGMRIMRAKEKLAALLTKTKT